MTGASFSSQALDAFTDAELADIQACADERNTSIWELLHDSVMNALAASPFWDNARAS